jgi:murein DD-endopeptidase MepM/ murein hydrolase activator NlpD
VEELKTPKGSDRAPEGDPVPDSPASLLDLLESEGELEGKPATRPEKPAPLAISRPQSWGWLVSLIAWAVALAAVAYAVFLWANPPAPAVQSFAPPTPRPTRTPAPTSQAPVDVSLPPLIQASGVGAVSRFTNIHTNIPNRPRSETIQYTVDFGDAIFSIASAFNISPETVLWANYDLLNDNPDFLEVGMELNIPPVNGVYYQWQEGDTIDIVAETFDADVNDILNFTANLLDLVEPVIEPGQYVMIPDGHREFRQWLIPVFDRGNAGVLSLALGPGACSGSYTGPVGSGAFIWPSGNHSLSGNDFWDGHLAIDIGLVAGDSVGAADAGVVVFSGWANGGYGNTVIVDHGNGYQTLYAHLNSVTRPCGAGVGAGTTIGLGGSTGNSTGSHLHFEVRYLGGFINPWFVLPPP